MDSRDADALRKTIEAEIEAMDEAALRQVLAFLDALADGKGG